MTLGDFCAECGEHGAGKRQLCKDCEPLYPLPDHPPSSDECECPSCRSDLAQIVPCRRAGE